VPTPRHRHRCVQWSPVKAAGLRTSSSRTPSPGSPRGRAFSEALTRLRTPSPDPAFYAWRGNERGEMPMPLLYVRHDFLMPMPEPSKAESSARASSCRDFTSVEATEAESVGGSNTSHGPDDSPNAAPSEWPSLGSVGHPTDCRPPCKYAAKNRGCKDGDCCDHCHLCLWHPTKERRRSCDGQVPGRSGRRRRAS